MSGNPEWWKVASDHFGEWLEAGGTPPAWRRGKPDWTRLSDLVLDEENLPVVCAALGLPVYCGTYPPGSLKWWPDAGFVWMVTPGMGRRGEYAHPARGKLIAIDRRFGAWRTPDNSYRGDDVMSLGAWIWGCPWGKAAGRIGRLCGLRGLPRRG